MDTLSRHIRGIRRAAFSSDEARIVTLDRYVSGWDAVTLQRVFRVRPMPQLAGLEFQPNGELMLSVHRSGHYALMQVRTGDVVATCGEGRQFFWDAQFALSACGRFVIEAAWGRLQVREISTNEVVWSRPHKVRRILPLHQGLQWALVVDGGIEVWSWPFAQTPVRTISLPGSLLLTMSVSGTLVAYMGLKEIRVVDIADERPVFAIARDDHPEFQWSGDGSLVVMKRGRLEVYDRAGIRTNALDAPEISPYGHAFSASGSAAVLCYLDGIVLIRSLRDLLDRGAQLPAPWTSREPGEEEHLPHNLVLSRPAVHTVVEAETPDALEVALEAFRRPAWIPVLRAERGPADGSKFGGVPWLAESEEWPCCGRCGGRMDLFLQLNSKGLPEDCPPLFDGLLQVFVCTHKTYREICSLPHDAFANWSSVRILDECGGPTRYVDPPDEDLFDEQRLVGWVRQDDFPLSDELELAGVRLSDPACEMQTEGAFPFPRSGDKLLGWARWEQGPERVGCPRCGEVMRILFQIDACCGVPVMLGDGGIGWVSQCVRHPDVVTFHWSCG